jgi:hypothetical protein
LPLYKSDKDAIHKIIDDGEMEKRLLLVFEKKDTFHSIIKLVYPDVFASNKMSEAKIQNKKPGKSVLQAIVDNNKLLNCTFCPECMPSINDKIIAKSSKF